MNMYACHRLQEYQTRQPFSSQFVDLFVCVCFERESLIEISLNLYKWNGPHLLHALFVLDLGSAPISDE